MAIHYAAECATLEGQCTVEEAGDFAEWLIAEPARKVDLAACTGVHAAVLQCLMALAPAVVAPPQDAGLARWLGRIVPLPAAPVQPAKAPRRAPTRTRKTAAGTATSTTTTKPRRRTSKKAPVQ